MKPLGETSLILLSVVLPSVANYYMSILCVLCKRRNFFFVAHFSAAIIVFSARFGAACCCCNFAFCSTTYVRPLSHRSLLAFVTFVFFTLRCHLFFILRCHLFFFINHGLSHTVFHSSHLMKPLGETSLILLAVVLPSVANYYMSILCVLCKRRNFFSVAHLGAAILVFSELFGAASCCCNFALCSTTYVRLLSHLSLLAFVNFVSFKFR